MDQLEGQILQYEAQLAQVRLAASELPEGPERKNLNALETDLQEIIELSKKSLTELLNEQTSDDAFTNEYNLFKAELAELEENKTENVAVSEPQSSGIGSESCDDVKDALDGLKGAKCQAPFMYKWTNDVTYHNAFITYVPAPNEVNGYDNIKVKVMFTNPTHKEMLPCPYYLEGDCKFSDDKCRYSHGELVLLNSLKDYREPVFSNLSTGSKVFAKQSDGLWYRASVINASDSHCDVKFESNSKEEQIPLHNVFPLDSGRLDDNSDSDTSNSDSEEIDKDLNFSTPEFNDQIVKRILCNPPGSALGEWEKFTKGFGSKIMAKMGYIHGAGLGKNGLGRVEPVSAVILPAGKSLDHCMMLKEKAGNDKDLFKAERKLKILQKKHEEKLKKAYNTQEKTDVFTFLNSKLDPLKQNSLNPEITSKIKNETTRNLNVTSLQLAEESRKVEKDILSLNKSLSRHSPHSQAYNIIKDKLLIKEKRLSELQASQNRINTEQNLRRDQKKLTIF